MIFSDGIMMRIDYFITRGETMYNILIVDDEKEIVELISYYLKSNNYKIHTAHNGLDALEIVRNEQIDLAVFDVMMPKMDGLELLRAVRGIAEMPVIFLSAKDQALDKINGLFLGADDYMTKPFNPMELMARIQAHLRRSDIKSKKEADEKMSEIIRGDLKLDVLRCKLFQADKEIVLTSVEFKMMQYFMENPERVFTKRQIYEAIWEQNYLGDDAIVMVYISKLREKLEENPKLPHYIRTIRGLGYCFEG